MKKEIREVSKDGKTIQITIADERWYLVEDEKGIVRPYPSVTWITSTYPKGTEFYKWLASKGWNEAEAIKEAAGKIGYKAHSAIEKLLKGQSLKIDDKVAGRDGEPEEVGLEEYEAAMSFVNWHNKTKPELLHNETLVVSKEHNFAGTADNVSKINGQNWLIDYKISKTIWPSYELQLSAYRKALAEMGITIDRMAILQLGYKRNKDGYKFTEIEDDFTSFLAVKQLWKREAKNQEVFKADYPVELKLNINLPK